jgi:hypothetical protein
MKTTLTLGTAKILRQHDCFTVTYMNIGSFLVGTQVFGDEASARHFCASRSLRVISFVAR